MQVAQGSRPQDGGYSMNPNGMMYHGQQQQQQQHAQGDHSHQAHQQSQMQLPGHVISPSNGQQYMVVMPDQSGNLPGNIVQAFSAINLGGQQTVQKGIVKRWNLEKGYGFIQPYEGGDDVFVHHTVIHAQGFRSLLEGSDVEYTACQIAAGRVRATRVTGPNGGYVRTAQRQPNPPLIGVAGQGVQVVPLQVVPFTSASQPHIQLHSDQLQQQHQPNQPAPQFHMGSVDMEHN